LAFEEEMEQALASMRVDDVHIKKIGDAQNALLEKRRRRGQQQQQGMGNHQQEDVLDERAEEEQQQITAGL
jgi:hypothetical protein